MAFGNYQQNEQKVKSMNTKAKQFFNDKGDGDIPGSTLVLSYWNGTLIFTLHPLIPEDKRIGKNKYDYKTEIHSVLTMEKLFDFSRPLNTLYNNLKNGMKVNEFVTSFGIPCKNGFIEIANANKYGGSEDNLALCIYGNIDAETNKAEIRLVYIFNKSNYINNYDPSTGEFENAEPFETEFGLLVLHVNEAIKALTNAYAHTIRHCNMYQQSKTNEILNALAFKNGIDLKAITSSNNTSYSNSNLRFSNNQQSSNEGSTNIENGGTVEDRLPM